MRFLLAGVVTVVALALDTGVQDAFDTPKTFLLLIFTPLAGAVWWGLRMAREKAVRLHLTEIEGLLIGWVAWNVVTRPELLSHPTDFDLWVLTALVGLAVIARQISQRAPRFSAIVILLRVVWIVGLVQAAVGFYQWHVFAGRDVPFLKTPMGGTIGAVNGYATFLALSVAAALSDAAARKRTFARILIALSALGGGLYQLNPESSAGRLMIWEVSAPMVVNHPVTGLGYGRYETAYLDYQARYFAESSHRGWAHKAADIKDAHNEFLHAFCESGVPGGLLFLLIWAVVLWRLGRRLLERDCDVALWGVAAILLIVLIHGLVSAPLHALPVAAVIYAALGFVPARARSVSIKSRAVQGAVLLILIGCASGAAYAAYRQYSAYATWKRGVQFSETQRWRQAAEKYQAAMQRLPRKGELQFHRGGALVMSGAYSRGLYFLKRSERSFNDRNIYLSMSHAYLNLGDYEEAETQAKKALGMFPNHLAPHLLLGSIYYRQGRTEASKEALLKCIRRESHVQTADVKHIARDARRLWRRFYGPLESTL